MSVSPPTRATTARLRRFVPAIVIAGAILAACSSNDDNTTTPKASAIAVISGNAQTGIVGTPLPLPLVVKVTDQNGAAMSGVLVSFTATGGATLKAASASTDANGLATDSLTLLGSTVGSDTVTASVSGVTTSAIFAFTATAATPSVLAIVSGNTQTGVVGTGLTLPLVVKVTGQNGAGVSGVTVTFAATGGASLQSPSAVTDASGQATDSLTLLGTTAGSDTVTATVNGIATPVIFSFVANAGPAAMLAVVSGNNQSAAAGTALTAPLIIKVTDQFGNAVPNANIAWTTTAGTFVGTPQAVTDSTGQAQASLMLPAVAGVATVTATLQGTATVATFTETAM
jgi:adhesin/invasin